MFFAACRLNYVQELHSFGLTVWKCFYCSLCEKKRFHNQQMSGQKGGMKRIFCGFGSKVNQEVWLYLLPRYTEKEKKKVSRSDLQRFWFDLYMLPFR